MVACCAVMVIESYENLVFRFVIRISISLMIFMIFMLKNVLLTFFFTARTSLGCRKCLIGMLFDKLLSRTLYRTRFAAHVIFTSTRRRCHE